MGIRIRKTSSYLPGRIVDNFYFEGILDTSDDWISSRTGIKKRHFVEDEDMIDLIKRAVDDLNLSKDELKGIK
ncbi:MAG: ketoacyl-ACP synthase III, partial [Tissierellia bacterium]|nr:ketoacyl-ACP synthase III [Tissierellia bacterium]